MKFQDIKVGDVVYTSESHGLVYGWGASVYNKTFWIAHTVTKVTDTQFTAGGQRFKKSDLGVGHYQYAYSAGEPCGGGLVVPSECQSKEKQQYIKKIKALSGIQSLRLDIHKSPDIDTALKAADLIRQAHSLIGGDL